jgi:EmrB/QacA subfamily drug resistance transporter
MQQRQDAAPPSDPAPPDKASFLALFSAVMLPMFLAAADQTLLATATPRIAAELGGLGESSWIMVGYLLATTVSAPLYGRMGDRFGRRNAMLWALGLFVLGSLACTWAPSMPALIASRALQGLGGGGLMVLSHALIGELVPPWDRPRYQGYFAMVFAVASVTGPLMGGVVVNHGNWRWLFLANLPLCALAAWRVLRLPKAAASIHRNAPHDPVGVLLFLVCASAALLWLGQVGRRFAMASPSSLGLVLLALVAGALLWRQQARHSHPFLPIDVLRLRGVPWVCLSIIGFAGCLFAMVFLLPLYLHLVRGASAVDAGLQLLPLTLGLVAGGTLAGRFTGRIQRTGVLPPWGMGAAAVALLGLAFLPGTQWTVSIAAAICGMGFGTVMPNAQLATQVLGGREHLGASAALMSLTRSTGSSIGTAAFGGLLFVLLQAPGGMGAGASVSLDGLDADRTAAAFRWVFLALSAYAALTAFAASRTPSVALRANAHDDA